MDRFEQRGFSGLVVANDDIDALIEIDFEPTFKAFEILDFDLLDIHRSPHFPRGNHSLFRKNRRARMSDYCASIASELMSEPVATLILHGINIADLGPKEDRGTKVL